MGTPDETAGTATEAPAGTALTAENRSVEIDAATFVYRRFGDRRERRTAAAVPAALPRQPRQLGPRAGRPARHRSRGHPARQPRRRRLDRRRPRQRRGHGPRRPALHRRARAQTGRSARLLARRLRRAGDGAGAPAAAPQARARRHRTAGRSGDPPLVRRRLRPRRPGRAGPEPLHPPVLLRLGGEPGQGHGVPRAHLRPDATATSRPTSPRATPSSRRSRAGGSRTRHSSRGWRRSPTRRSSPTATTTR